MTTAALTHPQPLTGPSADITITDPRDGSLVGRVPVTDAAVLHGLVAEAARAFPPWSRVPPAERGRALRDAAAALLAHEEQLAELNSRETGRPHGEALGGVRAGADALLQYAEIGPLHSGRRLLGSAAATDYSMPQPRGVAAVITPWNDPVAVAVGLIAAALVMGNTVVHKPSERCPHLGELLGRVLAAAFPPGVLATATGGAAVGAALVGDPAVRLIAHVGSTRAGEAVAGAAASTGAHVVRENGGNDALIVDGDVDPAWAAGQAALGAFANVGQICTSVERIFVHADIAPAFIAALVGEARRIEQSGELAPLVDRALRDAVHAQVTASVAMGATVLTGGFIPPGAGSYYPPTVLADCTAGMPVMTEETFGPVAPVEVLASFEEQLERAANDRYGLAATVLTASMLHGQRAATDLPVGTVKINAVFGGAPGGSAQPRGASGSGYGYGPALLDEMSTTKVVHVGLPGGSE